MEGICVNFLDLVQFFFDSSRAVYCHGNQFCVVPDFSLRAEVGPYLRIRWTDVHNLLICTIW